jgi:hypothetical protein
MLRHDRTLRRFGTAIRNLKARPGGELEVHGSGNLIGWLLENNLIDEMNLLIVPVIVAREHGYSSTMAPTQGLISPNLETSREVFATALPAVRTSPACDADRFSDRFIRMVGHRRVDLIELPSA